MNPFDKSWQSALMLMACATYLLFVPHLPAAPPESEDATGAALSTIFSPDRAPPNRTMGLVQRNFLDLLEETKPRLQIAIAIDGTYSMSASLDSVKQTLSQMMDDLQLYKRADVGYQLVVYRDLDAESGKVSFPMKAAGKKFSSDRETVQRAIEGIDPESGAPYFHELIDLGIHDAIQDLEWSDDQDTSKWLLVIGDAPPFRAGFDESETGARRYFDERRLAALATSKQIRISCILVGSREEERAFHEQVLDGTRGFMTTIARETGGLMLDLSYPDIRAALLAAAKQPKARRTSIGKIQQVDIEQLRADAESKRTAMSNGRRAKLAVLPHVALEQMTFRVDKPEVRLASDLRRRFREIPGIDVKSSRVVRYHFERLTKQGLQPQQLLQMLANALGVDYLIWGTMEQENQLVEISSSFYRRSDGVQVGSGRGSRQGVDEATKALIRSVVNDTVSKRSDLRLVNVLSSIGSDPTTRTQVLTPVSTNKDAVEPLLEAYDQLEQAMAFGSDATESVTTLASARKKLEAIVRVDAMNPIAQQLLANCCFSQAQIAEKQGDQDRAKQEFAQAKAALERAKRTRSHPALTNVLKAEIAADYALLAQRRFDEAVRQYERLTDPIPTGTNKIYLQSALRAHWMLAGLRSGDWGAVNSPVVDPEKARHHLTAILAFWPESSAANYIRSQLRWSEQQAAIAFEHYPHQGPAFLDVIDKQ